MKVKTAIFLLIMLTLFSVESYAYSHKSLEFIGGGSYNTFKLDGEIEGTNESWGFDGSDRNSGFGIYGGVRSWIDYEYGFEFGIGFSEGYSKEYVEEGVLDENDLKVYVEQRSADKLLGGYLKFIYPVRRNLNFKAGPVYYSYREETRRRLTGYNDSSKVTKEGSGVGAIVGLELNTPLNSSLFIKQSIGYRFIKVDIDEIDDGEFDSEDGLTYDMSGFRGMVSLGYRF